MNDKNNAEGMRAALSGPGQAVIKFSREDIDGEYMRFSSICLGVQCR